MFKKTEKIGIFGGSFNPPHFGHLSVAKCAFKKFKLDKIIFIPVGIQPLKPAGQTADSTDRYEMTKFLVAKDRRFAISDMEIKQAQKGRTSYTIKTIAKLQKKYSRADLYLIIGEDSLREILEGKWKNGFALLRKIKFIVSRRKDRGPSCVSFLRRLAAGGLKKRAISGNIQFLEINSRISGTEIREKIRKGENIKKFVLNEVNNYIMRKKLYPVECSRGEFSGVCRPPRIIYISRKEIPEHLLLSRKKAGEIARKKIKEIKRYFKKSGFTKGIIGLSGGIDSALAAVLVAKSLGPENLIIVRMPYFGVSDKKSLKDASELAKSLKIPASNILTAPINEQTDASWRMLKKYQGGNINVRKGNLMARERMKVLFDLSAVFKAIVIGTEDRSEEKLGYYTLWGDQASGLEPIYNLWKTQIYQLAGFFLEIPEGILRKAPSPGLWKGQSAEGEMKMNYLEIDTVLSAIEDLKMPKARIIKKFGISSEKITKILNQTKIGKIKKFIPYILNS